MAKELIRSATSIEHHILSWEDGVVTISKALAPTEDFDAELQYAKQLRRAFVAKPLLDWGCDGIGYYAQRRAHEVRVLRSKVSYTNWVKGLAELRNAGDIR